MLKLLSLAEGIPKVFIKKVRIVTPLIIAEITLLVKRMKDFYHKGVYKLLLAVNQSSDLINLGR